MPTTFRSTPFQLRCGWKRLPALAVLTSLALVLLLPEMVLCLRRDGSVQIEMTGLDGRCEKALSAAGACPIQITDRHLCRDIPLDQARFRELPTRYCRTQSPSPVLAEIPNVRASAHIDSGRHGAETVFFCRGGPASRPFFLRC